MGMLVARITNTNLKCIYLLTLNVYTFHVKVYLNGGISVILSIFIRSSLYRPDIGL